MVIITTYSFTVARSTGQHNYRVAKYQNLDFLLTRFQTTEISLKNSDFPQILLHMLKRRKELVEQCRNVVDFKSNFQS